MVQSSWGRLVLIMALVFIGSGMLGCGGVDGQGGTRANVKKPEKDQTAPETTIVG